MANFFMGNTQYAIRRNKYAFTLVEILITVAIIGILAAIALPIFRSHSQQAKEAAAKDNLRILRNTIELYAAQHNGIPPGYPGSLGESDLTFLIQMIYTTNEAGGSNAEVTRTDAYPLGPYLRKIPANSFNNESGVQILGGSENFPEYATGNYGWIYQPATKTIRLDWPGTDSAGVAYYDY